MTFFATETETFGVSPSEAVMEAMTKSYERQRTVRGAEGKCWDASVDALCDLAMNHDHQFENLFVLSTEEIQKGSWLAKAGHNYQAYFVAQDTQGFWYMGSPSNYYATSLFRERSLAGVLMQAELRDGVNLPTAVEVSQKISEGSYRKNSRTECRIKELRLKGRNVQTKDLRFSFKG